MRSKPPIPQITFTHGQTQALPQESLTNDGRIKRCSSSDGGRTQKLAALYRRGHLRDAVMPSQPEPSC